MEERRSAIINNVYILLAVFFLITVTLIYTRPILIPFTISIFIYLALSPIIHWCQNNLKMNRTISIIVTLIFFLTLAGGIVILIANSFEIFFSSADIYKDKLLSFIQWGVDTAKKFDFDINAASIKKELSRLPVLKVTQEFTGGILSFLGNAILIAVFVIFLLVGSNEGKKDNRLIREIHLKISRYVGIKILSSLATACFIWILLLSFGVELASTFAILTFLLNFIPTVGSILSILLPIPILLLQFGVGPVFFSILIISSMIQLLIGNIIEPKIMGEGLDLHPITILLFLMFWGLVWGIPGMFLAVPMTAVKRIIFAKIENTKFLAEMLSGRIG